MLTGAATIRAAIRRHELAFTGWAGLAGACCYSWFVVAQPIGARLDAARAFISELSVPGEPASGPFRAADIAAGVLVIVLGAGVRTWLGRGPGPGSTLPGMGGALLGAVGASSIVDGVSPMTCAPSADEACRRSTRAAPLLTQLGDPHTVSGVVGTLAAAAAMVLIGHQAARIPGHGWIGRLGVTCSATILLAGLMIGGLTLLGGPGIGTLERVQVLIVSGWIGTISSVLIRSGPGV